MSAHYIRSIAASVSEKFSQPSTTDPVSDTAAATLGKRSYPEDLQSCIEPSEPSLKRLCESSKAWKKVDFSTQDSTASPAVTVSDTITL